MILLLLHPYLHCMTLVLNVSTRGHDFKLEKVSIPSNKKHANFFTYRIINYWNALLNETVNSGTMCTFDTFLSELY